MRSCAWIEGNGLLVGRNGLSGPALSQVEGCQLGVEAAGLRTGAEETERIFGEALTGRREVEEKLAEKKSTRPGIVELRDMIIPRKT